MNNEELLNLLKNQQIVIYGSGYVALRFFNALKQYNLDERVNCFVVSKTSNREDCCVNGIPLIEVEHLEVSLNQIICIAVHQAIKEEIIQTLEKRLIRNYIWIHPYLLDLEFGTPILLNNKVAISQLLPCTEKNYELAIRYAAIEQKFGINSFGYELYLKRISMSCSLHTACRRLEEFQKLITKWQMNGFDENYPISINAEYHIMDGYHRFTLACFFKQRNLLCNIYGSKINIYDFWGEQGYITRKMLLEGGFSASEVSYLDLIKDRVKEEYQKCEEDKLESNYLE